MRGLLDAEAYAFSALSVPYIVLALAVLGLVGYLLFTRGHPMVRVAMLAVMVATLVFTAGHAAALSCVDPELATRLQRISVTPVSLAGPACLALIMAIGGRLPHYRWLLALSVASSLPTALLTVPTDIVIKSVWMTPVGVYFIEAGPLNPVHVGVMVFWLAVGAVLAARASRRERGRHRRVRYKRMGAVVVLGAVGAADALLAAGIGYMPLSWVPLFGAVGLAWHTVFFGDLIRRRGRDRATGWEMLVVLALAVVSFAAYVSTGHILVGGVPVVTISIAVVALAVAQSAALAIRRRERGVVRETRRDLEQALDAFAELCADIQSEDRLADATRVFVRYHLRLIDGRLFIATDEGLVLVGLPEDAPPLTKPLDARVRTWLLANPAPLLAERIEARRLGGLRAPIESALAQLDAEVVLPLVDRDSLVGVFVTAERDTQLALSDEEVATLARVQDAVTRALTYMQLYREAEQRVEVAREVEIAAAVQHGRTRGAARVSARGCEITSYYLPAGQFGGDWWMHAELSDGRLLIVVGDVTGHGVPAALVTATVEGACDTAMAVLGAGFDVFDLLHLLNRAVRDVGQARYLMTCFAAIVDPDDMSVTFANAGHPFPYRCRSNGNGTPSELRALVSRGMPLGVEDEPMIGVARLDLAPDDLLVFYTDALVESESEAGRRYGDRRLQRTLRTLAHRAGGRVCEAIIDDARAHYGTHPIREDITLVCARIGRTMAGSTR